MLLSRQLLHRGLYHRTKRQCEQNGLTMEEIYKGSVEWEGDLFTEEQYIKVAMVNESKAPDPFEDCLIAKKVDVSGRDISHCDNLDTALGLTRSSDWTYGSICDKVLPCKLHVHVHNICVCFHVSSIHTCPYLLFLYHCTQWM